MHIITTQNTRKNLAAASERHDGPEDDAHSDDEHLRTAAHHRRRAARAARAGARARRARAGRRGRREHARAVHVRDPAVARPRVRRAARSQVHRRGK